MLTTVCVQLTALTSQREQVFLGGNMDQLTFSLKYNMKCFVTFNSIFVY